MNNNQQIAGLLRQIAALQEEQGVAFKPAAYRRAAKVIGEMERDVTKIADLKELEALPGIGESIAKKIREYAETGKITALEKLRLSLGGISPELMDIEGLGPKRVRVLQSELHVTTTAGLIKAAEQGRLKGLPGFSEVMQKKILENARHVSERVRRFPRAEVADDVEALLKKLRVVEGVERCAVAGSYRRHRETVGDIDALVVTKSAQQVSDAIASLPFVRDVVAHGDKKLSFDMEVGTRLRSASRRSAGQVRVDIRFVRRDQWGAALLYFTGDKGHNIALRKLAIRRGWKLNEYGLFEGETVIASREEEDIYKALGLAYLEPPQRTEVLP